MYAKHFHLTDEPFGVTPDPAYVYLGAEHQAALAAMHEGVVERRGIITLVGEIGTGKTTLLHTLLSRLGSDVRVVCVPYGVESLEKLLARILAELGAGTRKTARADLLNALHDHLLRHADQGITVALVIDEAQNLTDETLEELTLLSNFETYEHKLLQIVLIGEPELEERLACTRLRRLGDRVAVHARISPLSRCEAHRYIEHRLVRAGGSIALVLSRGAVRVIVRGSAGVPRRINTICQNALRYASRRDRRRVSRRLARQIVLDARGYLRGRPPRREEGGAALLMMFGKLVAAGLAVAGVAIVAVALVARSPYGLRIVSGADRASERASARDGLAARAMLRVGGRDGAGLVTAAGSACVDSGDSHGASEAGSATAANAGPPEPMPSAPPSLESKDPAVPGYDPEIVPAVVIGDASVAAMSPLKVDADAAVALVPPSAAGERGAVAAVNGAEISAIDSATPPAPRVVVARVREGSTLLSLGRELYGGRRFHEGKYLAEVRRLNPEVPNVDRILPGQRIRLPAPAAIASGTSPGGFGARPEATADIPAIASGRAAGGRRRY